MQILDCYNAYSRQQVKTSRSSLKLKTVSGVYRFSLNAISLTLSRNFENDAVRSYII